MWIAVEGPTTVGKSTLIETLTERLPDARQVHCAKPRGDKRLDVLREYVLDQESYKPGSGEDLLFDRLHCGEITYAPIYRPETNSDGFGLLGRPGWRWTEMFLASRGCVVALLTADNSTLAHRLEERGDDHVTNPADLFQVANLYNIARRESISMLAGYDMSVGEHTDEKYAAFVDELLSAAKAREERSAEVLGACETYIGSLYPSTLLIGDARNIGKKHGELTKLPFLPIEGNSGEYLLDALPDQFWRGCGIINGSEVERIGPLWETLEKPKIVALGNNAAEALHSDGFTHHVNFEVVAHPQYRRRFQNGKKLEYGKEIVAAVNSIEEKVTV